MSRVYISSEFPESVARVFSDVLQRADCISAENAQNADIQIINHVPSDAPNLRTLIVQSGDDALALPSTECRVLKAPFTISRLMMELHAQAESKLPALAHGWLADAAQRAFTHLEHGSITLTEREWDICSYLLRAQGATTAQDAMLRDIWRYDAGVESHTLETHMYRLRQKLEQYKTPPFAIETTEGGYRAVTEKA